MLGNDSAHVKVVNDMNNNLNTPILDGDLPGERLCGYFSPLQYL